MDDNEDRTIKCGETIYYWVKIETLLCKVTTETE